MKKVYILMMTVIIITLIGAAAVYKFVVQVRLQELAEAQAKKEQLFSKISEMEERFSATIPPAVIRAWREKAEPWRSAAENRTSYFDQEEDLFAAKVPEGEIPRFYYNEEIRKRADDLNAFLRQNNTFLNDPYFGVPNEGFYGRGTRPTAEEVEAHLNKHAFGASLARRLSRAGMLSINTVNIWPNQTAIDGQVGTVSMTITGISGTMTNQALIRLIEQLRTEPRYFAIYAVRVVNTNLLSAADPTVDVEFLLAQSDFEERQVEVVQAVEGGAAPGDTFRQVFQQQPLGGISGAAGFGAADDEDSGTSWWQNFRRRFIPF